MGITVFALGQKAFACLDTIAGLPCASLLEAVVVGRDAKVTDDYAEQIQHLCKSMGVRTVTSGDPLPVASQTLVAIGWRSMIKADPAQTLIVLHDSLLPRYRGFNPLVTALINGDAEIGVTALFAVDDYDAGDILEQERVPVTYPIRIEQAVELVSACYSRIFRSLLTRIYANEPLQGSPQLEADVTYSLWRDSDDYFIDWRQPAAMIRRMIDAVGPPYAGAKTRLEGRVVTIAGATEVQDVVVENRVPGKVIFKRSGKLVVVCGSGLLMLDSVLDESGMPEFFDNQFRLRFW